MIRYATVVLTLLIAAAAGATDVAAPNARGLGLFRDYVEPMFKQHCYECHSHEFEEASGGLVVDSRAAMLKGGDLGPALVSRKARGEFAAGSLAVRERRTADAP